MKMHQLYTAYYSDKTGSRTAVYEKPLDWIYAHQNGRNVEIRPTIWLWNATGTAVYFVDYVGECVGCTLDTFDGLAAAQKYADQIGQMEESEFEEWLTKQKNEVNA